MYNIGRIVLGSWLIHNSSLLDNPGLMMCSFVDDAGNLSETGMHSNSEILNRVLACFWVVGKISEVPWEDRCPSWG
jgi:hypothetical protein